MVVEFARMDACSLLEETEKAVSNAFCNSYLASKLLHLLVNTHSLWTSLPISYILLCTSLHLPAGPTSYTLCVCT